MLRTRKLSLITFLVSTFLLIAAEFLSPSQTEDLTIDLELNTLSFMRQEVEWFQKETGSLPTDELGLAQLTTGPSPFMRRVMPDSWGHPYKYRRISTAPGFVIYSVGYNGIDEHGEGDDITTSEKKYSCKEYGIGCAAKISVIMKTIFLLVSLLSLAIFVICLLISAVRFVRSSGG